MNPLVWLADGMAARRHEPTFVITPHYGPLIEGRGYPWIPVGTKEDFIRVARDPRVWSRMHGTRMVIAGMVRTLPAYQQVMERVKTQMAKSHPDLTCEFYLMALDGKTERIV